MQQEKREFHFVSFIRTSLGRFGKNGMLCHKSSSTRQAKVLGFQQIAELQKGVVVIPVSIDNGRQGKAVAAFPFFQRICCMSGQSSCKNGTQSDYKIFWENSAGGAACFSML